jgi:hypothetical protein
VVLVVSDESGKAVAGGSGFIASSDGKIVTNHQVLAGAFSAGFYICPGRKVGRYGIVENKLAYVRLSITDLGNHVTDRGFINFILSGCYFSSTRAG